MSGASERANGRVSGPVLQSVFFAVLDHNEVVLAMVKICDVLHQGTVNDDW